MNHSRVWHNITEFDFSPLSASMKAWLTKPYILSQAFKRHCQQFTVRVLAQTEATTLLIEEVACLNETQGFIREVYLQGDGQAWSYGRITIPQTTLDKHQELFTHVGMRPFGETVLYDNPNVTRTSFQYCCLTATEVLFQRATTAVQIAADALYSRRSLFYIQDAPLLVTEIFLPNVPTYQND